MNVPVALFSGVRDTDLHFHQLHAKDHAPVEMRRFCAEEDAEVPFEEIAHGYETDDGKLIVLTDAELATAAPRKTRTIEIEAFVDLADIDPAYFDHRYTDEELEELAQRARKLERSAERVLCIMANGEHALEAAVRLRELMR